MHVCNCQSLIIFMFFFNSSDASVFETLHSSGSNCPFCCTVDGTSLHMERISNLQATKVPIYLLDVFLPST